MKCDEAAECVSALFDGEMVSRDAAEHIGGCAVCREQLQAYAEMGAELRRRASLDFVENVRPQLWPAQGGVITNWWHRGWEAMRIPRIAFAAMVVGLVGVSSSLVMVSARARESGSVMLLKVDTGGKEPVPCALSTEDKKRATCAVMGVLHGGIFIYKIELLSRAGDRVELDVRSKFKPIAPGTSRDTSTSLSEFAGLPEQHYQFEPGETLQMDVDGLGKLPVTGEWMDHMPSLISGDLKLDPSARELRIVSPVLVRGKAVVGDMDGGSAIDDEGRGVAFYMPGQGRFQLSLARVDGAVEGQVKMNRVLFESGGEKYTLLTGAPVSRVDTVWVLRDAGYRPAKGLEDGFIGSAGLRPGTDGAAAKQ